MPGKSKSAAQPHATILPRALGMPRPKGARPLQETALLEPRPHDNLHLFNSLTGEKEPFRSLEDRVVSLYVCGVTPYDVGHLGHALTYVVYDVLRRWLEHTGNAVRHIQNITDIDDDMVRKSSELGVSIAELTERNHGLYLDDMDALNVLRPDAYPRVSDTMDEIIEMAQELIDRGFAYEVDHYVFFDISKTPQFGVLAGMTVEELRNAPRTDMMPDEPDHLKQDALDFLIWQPSTAEGASFESPWGPGRPGWHIECSAMGRASLGDRIDIHGGGRDLRYPHHDSEIVQSECATGLGPYVQYWVHNGTMNLDGVKMSKSLGNLVKVTELLAQGHTPDAIRLMLLGTHYRADRDFAPAQLDDWEQLSAKLRAASEARGGPTDQLRVQAYRTAFSNAMDDDLDTPTAIRVLEEIADGLEAGRLAAETSVPTLLELADVLGLRLGREG